MAERMANRSDTSDTSGGNARILHVIGSPKAEFSMSTRIARAFLDAYHDKHPQDEITELDVWNADLPPFDGEMAIAKLAPILGEQRTVDQEAGWNRITRVIDDFTAHDKIVISTPMWNFGLPYALKHYIDILVQPGISFGVNASHEHIGLLQDRPVQLVLTRSSPMPEHSAEDFQGPYLQHILSFMGLIDVRVHLIEGTTLPQAAREELMNYQCGIARGLASDF